MSTEIPKALTCSQNQPFYFSANKQGTLERTQFRSHSWSSLNASLKGQDFIDNYCARKSTEAFNRALALNPESKLESLTPHERVYINLCALSLDIPLNGLATIKTTSIFKSIFQSSQNPPIKTETNNIEKNQTLTTLRHRNLINLLDVLYPKASSEGICHGFALMGMQAALSGTVDLFNKRLEKLDSIFKEKTAPINYKEVINEIEHDCKQSKDYDLLAFLEGIELCMYVDKYPKLFEAESKPTNQHSVHSTISAISLVTSSKLEETGELINMKDSNFCGNYHAKDLLNYFTDLKKVLEQEPRITTPFALKLSNLGHTITVSYDPAEKTWLFIDANQIPIKKFQSSTLLASHVFAALSDLKKNEYCPIATQIYTLDKQESSSIASLGIKLETWKKTENFKKMHQINPGSPKNDSLLHISISSQNIGVIKELIAAKANLEIVNKEGYTPLMLAMDLAYVDILAAFFEPNADGTIPQIKTEPQEIIHLLIQAGANIHNENPEDLSPLKMSSLCGDIETVKMLIAAGADITQADSEGNTALTLARQSENTEIANLLEKAAEKKLKAPP